MAKDFIGYDHLVDKALRGVVRDALTRIQKQGLIGSHHFYITFKTHDPGVEIPDFLRERYPDEMTIVLQNQFSGLRISDESFEVTLSFQKLPVTLLVPFPAVTGFADPSVQFGLQFKNASAPQQPAQPAGEPSAASKPPEKKKQGSLPAHTPAKATPAPEKSGDSPQIVSLDKFRKK